MAATINTNLYSLNAQANLAKNSIGLQSAIERLSSGLRVNSAKDDASGLARGMGYDSTARTLSVQARLAQDTISTNQTEDGKLSVVNDILQRMIELKADTNAGTANDAELGLLATQATSLQTGLAGAVTVTSSDASATLATSVQSVATQRATRGAAMNNAQFDMTAKQIEYTNTKAAYSRIMDTDFAEETSRLSRFQVLQQAGTAMVAQANAVPQNVLTLLR
jgi:flagellin